MANFVSREYARGDSNLFQQKTCSNPSYAYLVGATDLLTNIKNNKNNENQLSIFSSFFIRDVLCL